MRELPPRPVANENKPAMVVKEVIIIGITRLLAADTIEKMTEPPSLRRLFAVEINTMAEFTAIPAKATTPYMVNKLSGY